MAKTPSPKKTPDTPMDMPWIARAIGSRGGNYSAVEEITAETITEVATRLQIVVETLLDARRSLDSLESKPIQVVALRALSDSVAAAERHSGVIMDCLTQLRVHEAVLKAKPDVKPRKR